MPLKICATPIGDPGDITLNVLAAIKEAELVIGEEAKTTRQILKDHNLTGRPVRELNEHTKPDELVELVELCKTQNVVYVSDCGTPGFCDPGSELVKACREAGIRVNGLPGASSLMLFISICGRKVDQFFFAGFLPRETEDRKRALHKLPKDVPVLMLETPYRLAQLLTDLKQLGRPCVLGLDLTLPTEALYEGTPLFVSEQVERQYGSKHKAEVVVLLEVWSRAQ